MEIKSKIRDYILDNTFSEKEKLKDETLIFKEGFFDSMGFVTLLGFIEEEFKVTPNDEDLIDENFESINAITAYIEKNKAA